MCAPGTARGRESARRPGGGIQTEVPDLSETPSPPTGPAAAAPGLADVEAAIRRVGLLPRGAFHPVPADGVPDLAPGRPARTLVLVGHAGPEMWRAFAGARRAGADPLDEWSREVVGALAGRLGAAAHFPFARPYLPFQRWARRAESCHVSPLGLLIHPDYGLWHGYRGALAFADRLDVPAAAARPSPCDDCAGRPCLSSCPVGAFAVGRYDVAACVAHLVGEGGRDCLEEGCRARRACPVGRSYRYAPEQAGFHMRAFLDRRLKEAGAGTRGDAGR